VDGGGFGIEEEGFAWRLVDRHGVSGEGCEIGEEGAKAVDAQAVVCSLGSNLAAGGVGSQGGRDDGFAQGGGAGAVVILEEDGGEGLAHVPLEVIGEHAEEDVGAHAVGEAMVDGSDLEIDGLDRAEGALDEGEALVCGDRLGGGEGRDRHGGANDVEAVEGGFVIDVIGLAHGGEAVVGDGELEVLGHLVAIEHLADRHADLVFAAQPPALALGGCGDLARLRSVASSRSRRLRARSSASRGLRQTTSRSPG
jgi:hypothetical protein